MQCMSHSLEFQLFLRAELANPNYIFEGLFCTNWLCSETSTSANCSLVVAFMMTLALVVSIILKLYIFIVGKKSRN